VLVTDPVALPIRRTRSSDLVLLARVHRVDGSIVQSPPRGGPEAGRMARTKSGRLEGLSLMLPTFGLAALLFGSLDLVATYRANRVRHEIDAIVENMRTSIELVARMHHDVDRERILLEIHIFEKAESRMARLDAEIAGVDADFASAAEAYEPLAVLPDEAAAWRRFKGDVAALQVPVRQVLMLSHRNLDYEAHAAALLLEAPFAQVDADVVQLIGATHGGADVAIGHVTALQWASIVVFAGFGVAWLAIAVLLGRQIAHLAARRDEERAHYEAELEERNRDLDAFAGRVAHDLRGPLTTIGLASQQLAGRSPAERGTAELLGRGVARMKGLIEDLLALSRIDSELRGRVADPAIAVAQVCDELAGRIATEGGTLRAEAEAAQVRCAEGLLRQVVWNLVENAIKYRRPGVPPQIEVRGAAVGRRYELRVSDNGTGMEADEARHAFEAFYRAPRVRDAPGTGLGLAIVKRVIEASGGTISIASALGQGTTFVIELPSVARDGAEGRK
jgi:two-component system, OmpR family, sensor kinase